MTEKLDLTLTVNSCAHAIRVEPRKTLADAIRDDCGLTGTHIGCEHGVCGACTVILDGEAVRSCLMFAVQAQGKSIRTVEGLAENGTLHPLQRAFMAHHSLQCGFCTPGFLMLAAATLERDPSISDEELLDVLSSNLCRCTGYATIVKAVRAVRDEARPPEPAVMEAPKEEIDPAQEAAPSEPSAWGDMLEQSETAER
jgi:aerobic-type carbon monoxide dehydrogenase small subunit (CoxS/CutS family)